MAPSSIEDCRLYVTSKVELQSPPNIRHISIDLAVPHWEISHHLRVACSAATTQSLKVFTSDLYIDERALVSLFLRNLVSILPSINHLAIHPLEEPLQIALCQGYSSTLTHLTIHSAFSHTMTWNIIVFPHLEELNIIEDRSCALAQKDLGALFVQYVRAPLLRRISLIGATDIRLPTIFSVLSTFQSTIEEVRLLGNYLMYQSELLITELPMLPRVTSIYFEGSLGSEVLPEDEWILQCLPNIRKIVFVSDWASMERGGYELNWNRLQRCFEALVAADLRPTIVCGYRAVAPIKRDIYLRFFVNSLFKATNGWNITTLLEVEQEMCSPVYRTVLTGDEYKKRSIVRSRP
ncbi:hypothetical protein VNI00_013377 [Paramarasmius palmivorus]|uniref:Uncharacterized protein n=1 Tax=Paramarasmius palmivorus TaxID=297713 RepID=A0AAW0C2F3_9AGAR